MNLLILSVFIFDALLLCVFSNLLMQLRLLRKNPGAQSKERRDDVGKRTEKMVITAMMLAFALALKYFSVTLPLMGSNGLRFGFAGIFTVFPAILFGPLYGGITSALTDLLGFFMKPSGDYNFLFTLMAFIGGFLKGLLWLLLKKTGRKFGKGAKIALAAVMCVFLVFGSAVMISLNRDGIVRGMIAHTEDIPVKDEMTAKIDAKEVGAPTRFVGMLTSTKGTKTYQKNFATYANLSGFGIALVGLLGLAGIGLDALLDLRRKKAGKPVNGNDIFIKILMCMLISGLIVTTVNSKILIELYGIKAPFLIYWLPRLAEEIIVCTLQAYIAAAIFRALEQLFRQRRYI